MQVIFDYFVPNRNFFTNYLLCYRILKIFSEKISEKVYFYEHKNFLCFLVHKTLNLFYKHIRKAVDVCEYLW